MDKGKIAGDVIAAANVVATIIGWLPEIAAVLSIAWIAVQFYDRYKAKQSKSTLPQENP